MEKRDVINISVFICRITCRMEGRIICRVGGGTESRTACWIVGHPYSTPRRNAILRGSADTKTDSSSRVIRPKIKSFHRMHAKMISDRGDLQTAMVRSLTALNRKRKGRNYLGLDIKLYLIFHAKNWLKTVHTLVA